MQKIDSSLPSAMEVEEQRPGLGRARSSRGYVREGVVWQPAIAKASQRRVRRQLDAAFSTGLLHGQVVQHQRTALQLHEDGVIQHRPALAAATTRSGSVKKEQRVGQPAGTHC